MQNELQIAAARSQADLGSCHVTEDDGYVVITCPSTDAILDGFPVDAAGDPTTDHGRALAARLQAGQDAETRAADQDAAWARYERDAEAAWVDACEGWPDDQE